MDCVRGEKSYWVCHLPDYKIRSTADELSYTQEHNHCPDSAAIDIDIEKNISFHTFSRKVSVGECRRVSASVGEFLKKLSVTCRVGQWSCRRVGCR